MEKWKMQKQDLINTVVNEMTTSLEKPELDRLKIVLTITLAEVELVSSEKLPSTEVRGNEWIIQKYWVDNVATGNKHSTVKKYLGTLKRFFLFKNKTYDQITGDDISHYLAEMDLRKHASPNYKVSIYKDLTAFFNWAFLKHYIDNDIARDVEPVRPVQKKKERLTDEEVEKCRVVASKDPREAALFELMLSTGMRVGEIATLRIENIDFNENEIKIWGEKTSTERVGFLTPSAKIALKRYLNGRTEGFVMKNKQNDNHMSKTKLEEMAKKIARNAGCTVNATLHVYRKTFASVLYRKTGNILLVSKLLGHADTRTTIKFYLVDEIKDMKYQFWKCN